MQRRAMRVDGASRPAGRLSLRSSSRPSIVAAASQSGSDMSRRHLLVATTASGLVLPGLLSSNRAQAAASPESAYDFSALMLDNEVPLSKFKNKVTVIVNVASE
ncbi:hypothetical protein FOA52_015381 [Chlamydomonas sp. UWO 241]|nr:hypothetical protein FOA52_015381 [Chlamydomonas sp. UWO 241]